MIMDTKKTSNRLDEIDQDIFNYRAGQHFLRKWYRLQENINDLNEFEIVEAKILFSSLNKLSEDERGFLAAKYNVPKRKTNGAGYLIKDIEVAQKFDMDLKEYRNKRHLLEEKLSKFVNEYKKKHKKEWSEAIILIHGRKR